MLVNGVNAILLKQPKNPAYLYTPSDVLSALPALYATEKATDNEKQCVVKFFAPGTAWTWYGIEFDPSDGEFFGYEVGDCAQGLTYFSVDTLKSIEAWGGLPVERDLYFRPTSLTEVKKMHSGGETRTNTTETNGEVGFVADDEEDSFADDFLLNSEAANNPLPYLREIL